MFNLFLCLLGSAALCVVIQCISRDEGDLMPRESSIGVQSVVKEIDEEPRPKLEAKVMGGIKQTPIFPVNDFKEKLKLISFDSRPDLDPASRKLHLQLHPSGEMIDIRQGERAYLEFRDDQYLTVGSADSPLWVEAYQTGDGGALLKGGLHIARENGEAPLSEAWEFRLDTSGERGSANLGALVKPLQESKWLGGDRLIDLYGGSRYENLKWCQRIETSNGNPPLYVRQGEYLVFDHENLVRKALGPETEALPLFYLRSVFHDKLCWDVWDEKGVHQGVFEQYKDNLPPFNLAPNTLFSHIRKRSRTVVTCRIENKMVVLKKGDWLLRTENGWQNLMSLEDMSSLLSFDVTGTLFIFDGVEPHGEGNIFLGSLFDPTRTQSIPVTLPLPKGTSFEHSSHTKKTVSPTLSSSAEEELEETSNERRPKKAYRLEEEAELNSGY